MDAGTRNDLYDKFDAKSYIEEKATTDWYQGTTDYLSEWMHSVFKGGNIKGDKLLDIGTGPDMKNAIYAAPYFNNIYLSDFSKTNRLFLEEWRNGKHSKLLRFLFDKAVELEENGHKPEEMEETLRSKVKDIYFCDITQSNPLGCDQEHVGQFDAVTMTWVAAAIAYTEEEYKQALKNVISLIKPGGYLIIMDINGSSPQYYVEGVLYPSTPLKDTQMIKIVESVCTETSLLSQRNFRDKDGVIYYLFNMMGKV